MSFELEKKEMVETLTVGIGAELGRKVRLSFFTLAERLMKYERFITMERPIQQMTLDLLALSIFYNEIICPLEGSQSFLLFIEKANASHIRIGSDKLTDQFAKRARNCVSVFYSILNRYKIPNNLLSFSSLNSFLENIETTLKQRQDESMD